MNTPAPNNADTVNVPESAVCAGCGYSLRGLPRPICPECGRPFDPGDCNTYHDLNRQNRWVRWAQPPPLWQIIPTVFVALATLDMLSQFGASTTWTGPLRWLQFISFLLAFLGGGILLPAFLVSYLIRIIATRRTRHSFSGQTSFYSRDRFWRWSVLPVCLALMLSHIAWPWSAHARFALSRSALARTARSIKSAPPTIPRGIGLYQVSNIETDGQRVLFTIGFDLIDPIDIVYDPNATPTTSGHHKLDRSGTWYIEPR